MSAKLGANTTLKPKSSSDHAACSRLEPQPKFAPATRIFAFLYCGLFSTKSGFSLPSGLVRISWKSALPRPVRAVVFRNCFGMIMSVSTLIMGRGAATAVSVVNFSMAAKAYPPPRTPSSQMRLRVVKKRQIDDQPALRGGRNHVHELAIPQDAIGRIGVPGIDGVGQNIVAPA